MIGPWRFHGHAIVSADDRIAGADGLTPPALRNEADWVRFQAALDRVAVTVLGRLGHEANPNLKQRNRLVLSATVQGIERRRATWWWNPAKASLADALAQAAPGGGIVAVPGGRRVFDLFLEVGYDAFDLACAARVVIPDGVPIFSAVASGVTAADLLSRHGLTADSTEAIDSSADISFAHWVRRGAP